MNHNSKLLGGLLGLAVCFNVCSASSAKSPDTTHNHSKTWLAQNFELPGDLDINEDEPSSVNKSPISLPPATPSETTSVRSLPAADTKNSAPAASSTNQAVTLPAAEGDRPVVTGAPATPSATWQSIPAAKIDSPETQEEISPEPNIFSEDEDLGITRPELALISFDNRGLLKPTAPPLPLEQSQQIIFNPEVLFNAKATENLTDLEKAAFIKNLALFMQSDYASKVILPRKVLVVRQEGKNLFGHLYDLELLDEREVRAPLAKGKGWQNLCDQALQEWGGLHGVVVNMESKQYHQPGATHLSLNSRLYAFKDEKLAKRKGYEPCAVCFPKADPYLSMSKQDRELSKEGASQVQSRYSLSQDSEAISRVQKVGRRLLEGNGFSPDLCDFVVLNSPEAQALSVPGGPVFVTSGLLKILESDDELAAVLAHEFAHILHKHGSASKIRGNISNILGTVMRYTTRSYWGYFGSQKAADLINKGFSREQEYEADRSAVQLSFAAGYNPQEFCATLEKLELYQQESGQAKLHIPWFSTHPTSGQRIQEIKKVCQEIEPLQKEAEFAQKQGDKDYALALRHSSLQYLKDKQAIDELCRSYNKLNWDILHVGKGF